MQFDKATIHNLAAEMFWRMAEDIGVAKANERVLATEGRCLLEHPVDNDLWREYPLTLLPDDEARRVLRAVSLEAFEFARDEQNMIGPVFLEDRQTGRSPSAVAIDTQPLAKAPSFTSNEPIERTGRLCLRHPLPAVVFADRQPRSGIIQVDDTATALSFDLPMFLALTGCQPAPDDTVILTGYFHIPAPDVATGDLWNHVIQNSTRAVSGVTIFRPEGQIAIDFDWDAPAKRRSWFRRP
ncbi:hypothetical protein [Sphingomonas carotinifaciens]|uniref:Uncharacterized protein n=1 Tax=Sphingomonas carotinifaciens TaxID=1166323 RepID=A0A1G7RCA8_9SPHN|nr:hypothetical protein [Sphingomonas carotinifaciens]MBB4087975.1 hypothetical protein [Sphingomonas carotinifaciens]MWC45517.1 hypothetical protein [Sphingomonas carotinifaciens]SDG08363.1 hypothetical protein SAMN05216557_11127 [Sphingomonas carotinifaciens]